MIDLILISHGSLATGMREAAEMILGEQERLEVFGLFPGDTLESFCDKVEKAIEGFGDPNNILILSDLPCGTPSNAANMMMLKYHTRAVSGCNLPMLVEVLSMRDVVDMDELVSTAISAGNEGIVNSEDLLSE